MFVRACIISIFLAVLNQVSALNHTALSLWCASVAQPQNSSNMEELNKAIVANQRNPDLYISRGRLKGVDADYKGAVADFSKATEI